MVVYSCFDGISCGRVALERIRARPSLYLASEIDKHAITIAKKNYPSTVQLGSIEGVSVSPNMFGERNFLLFGGSPCQGFSFAGKQLNFNDPRSKLFFEFVRIREEGDFKYFLFENVPMRADSEKVITDYLGVDPIVINSALVSAQNRKRFYWTNIPDVVQPADRGIVLRDILEGPGVGCVKSHGEFITIESKSLCIDANYHKGADNHGQRTLLYLNAEQLEKARASHLGKYFRSGNRCGAVPFPTPTNRKSKTVLTKQRSTNRATIFIDDGAGIRRLTPLECERLQTLPDHYTDGAGESNTQRYKAIGNGWTVDVIAHILSFVPEFKAL